MSFDYGADIAIVNSKATQNATFIDKRLLH